MPSVSVLHVHVGERLRIPTQPRAAESRLAGARCQGAKALQVCTFVAVQVICKGGAVPRFWCLRECSYSKSRLDYEGVHTGLTDAWGAPRSLCGAAHGLDGYWAPQEPRRRVL